MKRRRNASLLKQDKVAVGSTRAIVRPEELFNNSLGLQDVAFSLGEDVAFKVINGELYEINDNFAEISVTEENNGIIKEPSVEVHIKSFKRDITQDSVPMIEVNVSKGISEIEAEEAKQYITDINQDTQLLYFFDEQNDQDEYLLPAVETNRIIEISELCRVCARLSNDLISIYSQQGETFRLKDKICKHLPITIKEDDRLPLHVCTNCIAQLNVCDELEKICIDADNKLKLLLDEEDKLKDKEAMSYLNEIPPKETAEEEILTEENNDLDNQNNLPENTSVVEIPENIVNDSNKNNTKFKVLVVKVNNQLDEAEIAQQAMEIMNSSTDKSDINEENEDKWSNLIFACTKCEDKLIGVKSFLMHHLQIHGIELYHCNICNIFFDDQELLLRHKSDIHNKNENNNVQITNVAEIHLVNHGITTSNKRCTTMKVSKGFKKINTNMKCKIVDAIQGIFKNTFICNECKQTFNTKSSLRKHYKISRHNTGRQVNCSLCRTTFKNYYELTEHKLTSHDDLKSFICNYCEKKFLTKRLLLRHITEHSEYKAYTCGICGKGYNAKASYEIHLSTHNTEKPFLCDLCGKGFKHASNLKCHKRSHLADEDKKKHVCCYCSKRFRCKFLLDEHARLHTGERPFKCEKCEKTFYKRQQLKQHIGVHSNDLFECHMCEAKFNRRGNLTEHIKKHIHKTKKYECRVCKIQVETLSDLVVHRNSHSKQELTNSKIKTPRNKIKRTFQCSICEKYLSTKVSLKAHMRIHTGEKPYECSLCSMKFTHKAALAYHKRKHLGEKPYTCQYCNEGFVSCNAKNIHVRLHTGEKPYLCVFCNASFRCASSLSQHITVHSTVRPFICDYCQKGFRRREALIIHVRTHTGERPFPCDICGRAFIQRSDMLKHKYKVHANEKSIINKCKICELVCNSRKELKEHEESHPFDTDSLLFSSNLLMSTLPEITIGQDLLDEGNEEEIVDSCFVP